MGGATREPVADAVSLLVSAMQAGEALIAVRDEIGAGFITGGRSESQPPWNEAAAWSVLVPHAEIRALEARAREAAGSPVTRGGSYANTRHALATLVSYARGMDEGEELRYAAELERLAQPALALRAVDSLPQWTVLWLGPGRPAPDCPYCGTANLRENQGLGIVACLFPRCPASRGDGPRAWAALGRDGGGRRRWVWRDGTVQP